MGCITNQILHKKDVYMSVQLIFVATDGIFSKVTNSNCKRCVWWRTAQEKNSL